MSLEEIYEIPIDEIVLSKDNVRLYEPEKDLDELAASIKKHGLLQPVVLLGKPSDPKPYKLISGQRRLLAHKKLKERTIKAVFVGNISSVQALIRSLIENMQRLDLNYKETAKAVTKLYNDLNKDERKVQLETGLSIRKIREYILIEAQATPKITHLLDAEKVTPEDVKRALRAAQANISKAEELLDLIVKYSPNSIQKRRIVQYGEKDKDASARKIIEDAMKPHVEQNIMISLPEEVRNALKIATKQLSIEVEELAYKVLIDWLRSQGYLK